MKEFIFHNKNVVLLIKVSVLGGAERQALGLAAYLKSNYNCNVSLVATHSNIPTPEFKVFANKPATLSNEDISLAKDFLQLYPNPTSSSFTLSQEVQEVRLFDVTGKLVQKFSKNVIKNNTYEVNNLNKGIYFIRIKDKNNQIQTKKLIIN